MGDEQRPEAQDGVEAQQRADKHEQQREGDAGDNFRVGQRNIGHRHHQIARSLAQRADAQRCAGPENGGDQAGEHGDDDRIAQQRQKAPVFKELCILVQGKAVKGGDIPVSYTHLDVYKRQMKIYLKIDDNKVKDVKFETFGCGSAIASSSMATEMIKGKPVDQVLELTNKAVVEALDGLPAQKLHCSVLAEEAVKAALKDYYDKNGIAYDEKIFRQSDPHGEHHAE